MKTTTSKLAVVAHALTAALQNTLDAYGDGMDSETLTEGREALAAYDAQLAAGEGGVASAALDAVYEDFAAKDNGDVPLERYPQGAIDALARVGWAVVPCNLPFSVLGDAAQAGVFETGNPKHGWDYLVSRTRIGPVTAAPQPAAPATGED